MSRACESMGVCQHPAGECNGACEKADTQSFWLAAPAPKPPRPAWFERLLITAWCGVTVGIVYGAVRHFWPQLDDQLAQLFWSTLNLWF